MSEQPPQKYDLFDDQQLVKLKEIETKVVGLQAGSLATPLLGFLQRLAEQHYHEYSAYLAKLDRESETPQQLAARIEAACDDFNQQPDPDSHDKDKSPRQVVCSIIMYNFTTGSHETLEGQKSSVIASLKHMPDARYWVTRLRLGFGTETQIEQLEHNNARKVPNPPSMPVSLQLLSLFI